MDPTFTFGGLPRFMCLLIAFNSVKLVLCPVDLVVTIKFELCANIHRHYVFDLLFDTWSFRNKFTLENSIDAETSITTNLYWLRPCEALFEVYMFEVGCHKLVFNRIAEIINCLQNTLSPTSI